MELIINIFTGIATTIANNLFMGYLQNSAKSYLTKIKIEIAQNTTTLKIMESLDPLLLNEFEPEQAKAIAENIKFIVDQKYITPSTFAEHNYNIDQLTEYCLTSKPLPYDTGLEADKIIKDLTKQICQLSIEMSTNVLPEWERISWQQNFQKLDEIFDEIFIKTNAINQKIEEQSKILKRIEEKPNDKIRESEIEYRNFLITDADFGYIHLKGIGSMGDKTELPLESTYIQLKLRQVSQKNASIVKEKISQINSKANTINIIQALEKSKRLIITGAPGTGKSTLMQFIALRAAQKNMDIKPKPTEEFVPFLFKVRSFKEDDFNSLPYPEKIGDYCAPGLGLSSDFTKKIFQVGRALVIIEGLDECELAVTKKTTEKSQRDKIISWVKKLIGMYPENYFIITSRPVGYEYGSLNDYDFSEYEIMRLERTQQKDFISKWYEAIETTNIHTNHFADAQSNAKKQATDLTSQIISVDSISPLTDTPLMLSVICLLHKHKGGNLSKKKIDLYNDCTNMLLYDWRSSSGISKSIIGDMDANDLRSLLRPLAWKMSKDGLKQCNQDYIINIFKQYLPHIKQPESRAEDIIKTIRDRTGILIENSPNVFQFSHLTFQEYLTAQQFSVMDQKNDEENKDDFLIEKSNDNSWTEIIPIAIAESRGNQTNLIKLLVYEKKIILACSALSLLDSAHVDLREFVISNSVAHLKQYFHENLIKNLIKIQSSDSAQILLRLMFELPTISSSSYFDILSNWEFEADETEDAIDIQSIAEDTILRCLQHFEINVSENTWRNVRTIGYYTKGVTEGRAGSWDCLMLGILDGEHDSVINSSEGKDITTNAVANYVTVLEYTNSHKGYLENVIWDNFITFNPNDNASHEKILMAMHFAWCVCDPDKNIQSLLNYISNFPRHIYPAFQIGIINNAMMRVKPSTKEQSLNQAKTLWRECANEIMLQICNLIPYRSFWHMEVGGILKPAPIEDRTIKFRNSFEAQLHLVEPFPQSETPYEEGNMELAKKASIPKKQEPFEVTKLTWIQIGTVAVFGVENTELIEDIANKLNSINYRPSAQIRFSRMGEEVPEPDTKEMLNAPRKEYKEIIFTNEESSIIDKVFCIIYIESQNSVNEKVFAFINIRGDRLKRFFGKGENEIPWNIANYATIVQTGIGELPPTTREKLERDYLFSEQSMNIRIFPPLEEVT